MMRDNFRCASFNVGGVIVCASTVFLSMVNDIPRVVSKRLIDMVDLAVILLSPFRAVW
jgi:hypothetical protein